MTEETHNPKDNCKKKPTKKMTKTSTENENTAVNENGSAFSLVHQVNGIAHLIMDVPNESMNTLKAEFAEQIAAVLTEIRADNEITGLVLMSGKKDSFVAGADINMLANCSSTEEAVALSRKGQMIFDQIEHLPIPVVAAIHGPCLGGGLELAMACHARVCSDSVKTVLALPEVQLGLLPGSGGTQRLPKLVGLQKSLDMMLTGKQLRAKQALKAGLVDEIVPISVLIEVAEKIALSGKLKSGKSLSGKFYHFSALKPVKKLSFLDKILEGNALGRSLIFQQASKAVNTKTQGNYPAPAKIIACVKAGFEQSAAVGYQTEADNFGQLVMTEVSKQLRELFFATTEMKKEQGIHGVPAQEINKIAVLGGGLMGGGIAFVSASKANIQTRIKDISHQGISHAFKYAFDLLNKKVKRRFILHSEMQQQLSKITGTTQYNGFSDVDFVIEAVYEDLNLKQQMVTDIETHTSKNTIFASNTSSLPIGQIAANAKRPENIIGLHYFSPVDKMPLAEIIPHEKTSEQTISTTVALAKKQGKTAIVVKDKAGFYVNRILAPYMNEAAILLLAGEPIEKIDKALVNFGFPVGPMQLLDEVGIDIGAKISPILEQELGARFAAPTAFEKLIDSGRLGKKSQKGFYQYGKKSKGKTVDESIYQVLSITKQPKLNSDEIIKRCLYMMLNEAARCIDEDIIRSPRDGDIGAIFGIGFPPFIGGPFRYIDKIGPHHLVAQLNKWSIECGERYKPCNALVKMAEEGLTYY